MDTIYIGTYTKNKSEGIYKVTLADNQLQDVILVTKAENPTYLAFGPDTNHLIAVAQNNGKGGVALYEKGVKKHEFLSEETTPCFVSYDGTHYHSAFYHAGKTETYDDTGKITEQKYPQGSKTHFIKRDALGNLWVVNLGEDVIYRYSQNKTVTFQAQTGQGPRHLVFTDSSIVYAICELGNDVLVLKSTEDQIELLQTIHLAGADTNQSAAIKMMHNGRYLYTSTRGDDFLSVFAIQDDGLLTLVQTISSYGKHPRDFDISPDDRYLVCANRDTNNLVLYIIDQNSGKLTMIQDDCYAPEAVCVLFEKKEQK